jgi:hypothetical protein
MLPLHGCVQVSEFSLDFADKLSQLADAASMYSRQHLQSRNTHPIGVFLHLYIETKVFSSARSQSSSE